MFYVVIAGGSFTHYVYYGLTKYFDGKIMPKWHIYTGVLTGITAWYCYYKACTTPPGIINKNNVKHYIKKYAYD